jgi:hypothetical protein
MKQQPDQLFREKLVDYSEPAPKRAWSRIEKELSPAKKESSLLWLNIAATVVLLLCAFIFVWQGSNKPAPVITLNAPPKVTSKNPAPTATCLPTGKIGTTETSTHTGKNDAAKKLTNKNEKQARTKKKEPGIINFSKQERLIVETTKDQPIDLKSEALQEDGLTTTTVAAIESIQLIEVSNEAPASKTKSSIIHYTAAEVNEKYKLSAKDDATVADENASSFRKLLDKAVDIKTNQAALAELRQRKNEILALNLDKKDGNDKRNN